ncbi:MAG: hypothetical protein CL916_08905, partial [Deltaproteobacteria bacterium]|nr:hypothetical protein [Deltaproteobacteria bacterium]
RFLRKGRNMLNIVGEKLHVNQVLEAAIFAAQETKLEWVQFRMIPDIKNSQHQFLVEFTDQNPSLGRLEDFMKHFDDRLFFENSEYPSKRKSGRLGAPKVIVMKSGWSKGLQALDIQNGKREVQYKWQYMADDWDDYSKTCIKNL